MRKDTTKTDAMNAYALAMAVPLNADELEHPLSELTVADAIRLAMNVTYVCRIKGTNFCLCTNYENRGEDEDSSSEFYLAICKGGTRTFRESPDVPRLQFSDGSLVVEYGVDERKSFVISPLADIQVIDFGFEDLDHACCRRERVWEKNPQIINPVSGFVTPRHNSDGWVAIIYNNDNTVTISRDRFVTK